MEGPVSAQHDNPPNGPRLGRDGGNDAVAAAIVLVVLLVIGAVWLGLTAAGMVSAARTATAPAPSVTPLVFPTPAPEQDDAAAFGQPLSAGCATTGAVWIVSDGGGIIRYDGRRWALIDPTLRSLVAAVCSGDALLAVGGAGRIVTVSDTARTVRADTVQIADFHAVSVLADGHLVAGAAGTVLRQTAHGWTPYARGIEEELLGIVAFSAESAWAVGASGVSYRLEPAGWRAVPTGVATTLRAVAAAAVDDVVAAGDAGTVLAWSPSGWQKVDAGTPANLRAALRLAHETWIVGDAGTALRIRHPELRVSRVDLRTGCAIRSVFARGSEVWFVGSAGTAAGIWRLAGDRLDRWGTC